MPSLIALTQFGPSFMNKSRLYMGLAGFRLICPVVVGDVTAAASPLFRATTPCIGTYMDSESVRRICSSPMRNGRSLSCVHASTGLTQGCQIRCPTVPVLPGPPVLPRSYSSVWRYAMYWLCRSQRTLTSNRCRVPARRLRGFLSSSIHRCNRLIQSLRAFTNRLQLDHKRRVCFCQLSIKAFSLGPDLNSKVNEGWRRAVRGEQIETQYFVRC
jgi:hypothetical protein